MHRHGVSPATPETPDDQIALLWRFVVFRSFKGLKLSIIWTRAVLLVPQAELERSNRTRREFSQFNGEDEEPPREEDQWKNIKHLISTDAEEPEVEVTVTEKRTFVNHYAVSQAQQQKNEDGDGDGDGFDGSDWERVNQKVRELWYKKFQPPETRERVTLQNVFGDGLEDCGACGCGMPNCDF
ncbi:hypothetical protein I302_102048 [Kwoniella bestiolae CBS 10118]|uniref:Uncharacterized protein n=1 Tax=Kwoniella bestiolae CBS 10118 TaxID=1296100 RepID=A0A1B9GDZ6_9TREE|nr:hypothetical protein I302_00733 [Kwoniella bestiolae CBS 10118]OCF29237.1 hypothetical protein I302_00733 [Kwoniella bestiolae CBS 10118]